MSTNTTYKTLSLKQQQSRNTETFSKAASVYSPNWFDEHIINLSKPNVSLTNIRETIQNESGAITKNIDKPLYSFVWFLN
jgi:hypothetical protein